MTYQFESFQDWDVSIASKEYIETIARHPFAVREMAKQNEHLQKLKNTKELNQELIEWLRASSDNDGKSLIDLS